MSENPAHRQRKGTDQEEAHALVELETLAFAVFTRCDDSLRAGLPVVDPTSDLGTDDDVTAPFHTSGRAFYAAIAAWETARAWAYRFRDHGLGVHVDYVMFRPVIENLLTAIWILGPDDSAVRVERTLRSWESELADGARFGKKVTELSGPAGYPGADRHASAIAKLNLVLDDVSRKNRAVTGPKQAGRRSPLTYTTIVTEAGPYVPQLGPLGTYWVWSVSSGMTHGQSLSGIGLSNFDATDRGDGHLDAEVAASPRVILHYVQSIEVMLGTLSDLFHRRLAAESHS